MMKFILSAALAAGLFYAPKAEASDWDMPAFGCVPSNLALQTGLYGWIGSGVGVAYQKTGSYILHCAVSQPASMAPPTTLSFNYTDNWAGSNWVVVYYRKTHKTTGVTTTILGRSSDA